MGKVSEKDIRGGKIINWKKTLLHIITTIIINPLLSFARDLESQSKLRLKIF